VVRYPEGSEKEESNNHPEGEEDSEEDIQGGMHVILQLAV